VEFLCINWQENRLLIQWYFYLTRLSNKRQCQVVSFRYYRQESIMYVPLSNPLSGLVLFTVWAGYTLISWYKPSIAPKANTRSSLLYPSLICLHFGSKQVHGHGQPSQIINRNPLIRNPWYNALKTLESWKALENEGSQDKKVIPEK
jgi:hypothetical protein